MDQLFNLIWVGVGSALGGVGRYWLSGLLAERMGETFPWGTLAVNMSGSFLIGLVAALTVPEGRVLLSPRVTQFFMLGVCGGYTTFSSFSLQTMNLVREGQFLYALGNCLASVLGCLIAVWLGQLAGQGFNR